MRIDGSGRATSPDLLVDVSAPGHVERTPDTDARSIESSWSRFRHVTVAVDLLVVDRVLIVVVRLEGELRAAYRALEAARVKESEVLQGTNSVDLVHRLLAAQTRALVEIRTVHPVGDGSLKGVFEFLRGVSKT